MIWLFTTKHFEYNIFKTILWHLTKKSFKTLYIMHHVRALYQPTLKICLHYNLAPNQQTLIISS